MVLIVALLASGIHAQNNNEMIRYRSTPGKGIEVSLDSGKSYIKRNAGLPIRIVYPFSGEEYHALGTIGYDTSQPQRAIIAMDNRLFITQNAGQHWDEISIPEDFNQSAMITAAAISSHNPNQIMIGTSFTGFYESTNGGESWVKVSDLELFDFLRRGAGFSEEISGLAYHPQQADVFYFELGFGGGVFRAEKQNGQVALIENASADDPALYTNRAVLPGDIYRANPMILSGLQRR
ncbi:MAG: hypothetical protein D6B26_00795, partial [Spirochaetaceae bacterium]